MVLVCPLTTGPISHRRLSFIKKKVHSSKKRNLFDRRWSDEVRKKVNYGGHPRSTQRWELLIKAFANDFLMKRRGWVSDSRERVSRRPIMNGKKVLSVVSLTWWMVFVRPKALRSDCKIPITTNRLISPPPNPTRLASLWSRLSPPTHGP